MEIRKQPHPAQIGKYLVLFPENEVEAGIQSLNHTTGVRSVARAADFDTSAVSGEQLHNTDTVIFDSLGVAIVTLDLEQFHRVRDASTDSSPILAIEPERCMYALTDIGGNDGESTALTNVATEYLRGYRDGVNYLVNNLLVHTPRLGNSARVSPITETWGLQATNIVDTAYSGRGIKLAVLDTGLDLTHPDFACRHIVSQSFIENQQVQDMHGHGTHCIGTACGSLHPEALHRYGIAYQSEIYVGKVLNNQGKQGESAVIAGINWAVANGCHIISMSLGRRTMSSEPFSRVYENIARRALKQGSLIIAAAGNESKRHCGILHPVAHPANCPSILAVAALDPQFQVASFSNQSINNNDIQIDIAAPGVDVYSTSLMPTRYRTLSGTSMAVAHVAGIAALYAEATGARGKDLWNVLTKNARDLQLPAIDVGSGLIQYVLNNS